ncbi:phage antirepressor KilAC domain-containing protein [Janthinobacterium sp. GB4P2]|uniref:phage antirepressor KilAC domain-containing protein n=1 Tax=Janthinobacterium sp. GB4P2 TaxID=3424189 RepID=UPI003F27B42D
MSGPIRNFDATMCSVDIVDVINEERKAEAAGSTFAAMQHKNFIAKVEAHPGIQSAKFLADYKDDRGRMQKCYNLPKREAELMVMSESLKVQTRVYDRLAAIEAGALPAKPAVLSRMDLIELAMAAERERMAADAKVEQLERQVADQAPTVAGFNLIADASGSMCFRDAAATLNMPQYDLTDYLVSKGWIYERAGTEGYKAYRARLQALDLRYNTFGYESKTTGERKARQQVRITNKGLSRLAEMIAAEADERKLDAATPQHQHRLGLDPS